MINSVDRDGMMKGYDVELCQNISSVVNIPVVACGGAGSLKDMEILASKSARPSRAWQSVLKLDHGSFARS